MKINGKPWRTIWLEPNGSSIGVIDQRKLPHKLTSQIIYTYQEAANAIQSMIVRGAPLIGVTGALFYFNRYPAKIFIGDIGTLGFGSVIASAVVMSGTAIYGVICLLPTFYELISTLWFKRKGIERREACMNPVIDSKGVIKPLEGASNYTLCFFLLSRFDLTERNLVRLVLFIYFLFGLLSIVLSYFLK